MTFMTVVERNFANNIYLCNVVTYNTHFEDSNWSIKTESL